MSLLRKDATSVLADDAIRTLYKVAVKLTDKRTMLRCAVLALPHASDLYRESSHARRSVSCFQRGGLAERSLESTFSNAFRFVSKLA